jgi:hypothetical protein
MEPEYDYGDILIKRVANGWLVATGSEIDEGQVRIFVYEDKEMPHYMSESLFNLLADQFEPYLQSKGSAGIKLSFTSKSLEEEGSEYEDNEAD